MGGRGPDPRRDRPDYAALVDRLEEHGYGGLYDYRKKQPSPKRVAVATLEQVLKLYQEKYFDFNVRHFHEKLVEEEDVHLSYTWVKLALQAAGLVTVENVGDNMASGGRAGRCRAGCYISMAARMLGFRTSGSRT